MRELLTARKCEQLNTPGRYCDGGGLWLQVSQFHTKSWIFQYTSPTAPKKKKKDGREIGRIRHFGLGTYGKRDTTLEKARDKAAKAREQVRNGIDPVDARKAERETKRLADAKRLSFKQCAEKYIATHEASWRNEKHRYQWKATLTTYAYPTIGELPVAEIDTALVTKVLEPIWANKTETAARLRGRIESVLDWAKARGYRSGENPARWKGHLDNLLAAPTKLKKANGSRHHPALPFEKLPEFMAELRQREGISARALEFCILTATRSGEVIGATWAEIDLQAKTWTVPASRMKAGKEHRVPLSERVLEILADLPREPGNPFVFIGGKAGASLTGMAMLELLRGMRPGLSVHGFRSTFRDWCAERTNYPSEVAEMALAHTVSDKVEAAYRRGDLKDKRSRLMAEWAKYAQQPVVAKGDNVTQLHARESAS
jgi:integrase